MPESSAWLEGEIPEGEYERVRELPPALLRSLYPELYALGRNYEYIERVADYLLQEFSAATNQDVYEKQRPFYDAMVNEIDMAPQEWLNFYRGALRQSSLKRRPTSKEEPPPADARKFATDARIIKLLKYTMRVPNSPRGVSLPSISSIGGGWVDGQAIVYGLFYSLVGEGILDPESDAESLRPAWEKKVLAIAERYVEWIA